MRLTNERDQEILRAGISDAAASLLEFMPTMGTGEAITFGEGVALPTRIKFDMLPADSWPKSNTASFTKNWAMDMPDDTFLHEIVMRWRAQSHNPDALSYATEHQAPAAQPAAASGPSTPSLQSSQPSLRRTMPQGGSGLGQAAPPRTQAPAPQAAPASPGGQQQSLASLIRQFRS
jgi:hypothetical protein